jgi:hypothetical protein
MSLGLDASTWDADRLQQEIVLRLPDGCEFRIAPTEDQKQWVASVIDDQQVEVWSSVALTNQLALLNLLGWLEVRNSKPSNSSPWVRRQGDLNPTRVHELVYSKMYVEEEIPDLDPAEVEAVYKSHKM